VQRVAAALRDTSRLVPRRLVPQGPLWVSTCSSPAGSSGTVVGCRPVPRRLVPQGPLWVPARSSPA